ncbi:MAG: IPT/TIG domain-containing protein [Blastocatellia bacterium]
MNLTKEQKQLGLIAALLIGLGGVVYYNFFRVEPETPRVVRRTGAGAAKNAVADTPVDAKGLPVIDEPLAMAAMFNKPQELGAGRNIFDYPPPPTPEPIKPTPPPTPAPTPPIMLHGVSPSGFIAQTEGGPVTITGAKIPQDVKAYISGREHQMTWVSENQVKITVPASTITAAGTLPIELRSPSDPQMFSNPVNLGVTQPPAPPYKYLGLYIKNGVSTAMLKFDLEEGLISVRRDTVLGGHWKVLNITTQEIEFEDTNIKVKHRIAFTGEGG